MNYLCTWMGPALRVGAQETALRVLWAARGRPRLCGCVRMQRGCAARRRGLQRCPGAEPAVEPGP